MIQGGEAGAPGLRVPGSRLAAVATGVRVLIGVELRAPGVYASKAGPAQGVEGAQPQAAAPGKARGWLPGSAGNNKSFNFNASKTVILELGWKVIGKDLDHLFTHSQI